MYFLRVCKVYIVVCFDVDSENCVCMGLNLNFYIYVKQIIEYQRLLQ